MASFEPGERVTMEWRLFDDLSGRELYELLRFRQNILIVEQRSPYPDLDCLDQSAWPTSAPYDDFGVEHVEMALRLQG
jgi:predicted GNAT family N-acyltransferase